MKLVVLSGSGISAESGIPTFRGAGGLWEGHDVTSIASPEAWENNPERVLRFYNERRAGVLQASPNPGHQALVKLEQYFDVHIITQNVDDLHERAGSARVLHLHGEILKCRSTLDKSIIIPIIGKELNIGDTCPLGTQLRPHIVWFGEIVENIPLAEKICGDADIFIVTGTSLQVYPASGLVYNVPPQCKIFIVDPEAPYLHTNKHEIKYYHESASTGLNKLAEKLIQEYRD